MVLAHPDDEVIFGWPILQDARYEKYLLVCSTDELNTSRKHGSSRFFAVSDLCRHLGIKIFLYNYDSEFYRLETRRGSLKRFITCIGNRIQDIVKSGGIDFVFTHNPYGEYGNLDHKLVQHICMAYSSAPLLYTDIVQEVNWSPIHDIQSGYKRAYYSKNNKLAEDKVSCVLDTVFYDGCKKFYTDRKAWTWSYPPIKYCKLFRVCKDE